MYKFLVGDSCRVLELGCGRGDLLASLNPSRGVGVDFSEAMIEEACRRHPSLTFVCADAASFEIDEVFDIIILSDLLPDLWDIQAVLEHCRRFCHPGTRIILNSFSRLWQGPLSIARRLGLAGPVLDQNWVTVEDTKNFLTLAGFEPLRTWSDILFPISIPVLSRFMNRYLSKLWPFRIFNLTNFVVARPVPESPKASELLPSVTVVIPARNESGHIRNILDRIPKLGSRMELIFVEGHSTDNTYEVIAEAIKDRDPRSVRLYRQPGKGKGDAVRHGFANATGDILMILDADLTVPPEILPRFYEALVARKGDFINGVRLVYPMEKGAMRLFNFLGNKFFGLAFSFLLGQDVKDTLCGTKVMYRADYARLANNHKYFGEFDPFGDFDLLFGAAKMNLKLVDMPIRYRERQYGKTNIARWRHGWILLRMVLFAVRRIKFV